MQELANYIKEYFGVTAQEASKIQDLFEVRTIAKNVFYVKAGGHLAPLGFLKGGFMRVYQSTEQKEVTQWIASPGEFITDLSCLVFHTPARWNIIAITDVEYYHLSEENYLKIHSIVPKWKELERLFISKCFLMLEDRVFSFIAMSAEERYQMLFDNNKELLNAVPHHYIASMLGMTPETLSRVRKKFIS